MTPFEVVLKLSNPALFTQPPQLDSILAWCAVQEAGGDDWAAGDVLPLEKRSKHGSDYWAASRFMYLHKSASNMILSKRIPYAKLEQKTSARKYVNPMSGRDKTFNETLEPQWVEYAIAYGVGNVDDVEFLLSHLTHFGRNTRAGHGRVVDYDVNTVEKDYSERIGDVLVRPVPASGDSFEVVGRCMPPYWKKNGLVKLNMPAQKLPFFAEERLVALVNQ